MQKIKALLIIVLFEICFFSQISFAATDGTLGNTSTGTTTITVTIPKLIRARNFLDFSFGTYSGIGDFNGSDDLNISTNYGTATRTYRVTATGSGTAGAFTITSGTATIAYNAFYNDVTGTTGRVALTAGTALTGQTGAVKPLSTATLNANLSIQVLEANMQVVDAGAYAGVITLVFTPE